MLVDPLLMVKNPVTGCPTIPQNGLLASYLLQGTAEDETGTYDGTEVSPTYLYDEEKGIVFSGTGSITIPATGGTDCVYWLNTGAGWVHTHTSTIPSSLATNKYSNLHIYNRTLSAGEVLGIKTLEEKIHNNPLDNGLLAYYQLDGGSLDNGINQYDLTNTAVTYVADVDFGTVPAFNGTTSHLTGTTISPTSSSFAFSFWVIGSDVLANADSVFPFSMGNLRGELQFGAASGQNIRIMGYDNYYDISNAAAGVTSATTWYHFTVSVVAGIPHFYVDGVEKTLTLVNTAAGSWGNFNLGRRSNGTLPFFGKVTHPRIYDGVLSESEIKWIYDFEKPDATKCIGEQIPESGLLSYYPFDANSLDHRGTDDGTDTSVTYISDGIGGNILDCGAGNVALPAVTGFVEMYYWEDSGAGMTWLSTTTEITSLTTHKYGNMYKYDRALSVTEKSALESKGY